jgi:hypothetical protein
MCARGVNAVDPQLDLHYHSHSSIVCVCVCVCVCLCARARARYSMDHRRRNKSNGPMGFADETKTLEELATEVCPSACAACPSIHPSIRRPP